MHPLAERQRAEYDLALLAPNGLRRGRSTGSCATAAVRAGLYWLLAAIRLERTEVSLPDGTHFISVPIQKVDSLDAQAAQAEVLKDGGDDPDNTHGATIVAQVRRNASGEIRFFAGEGVGTATMPGLRVAVGEPAINPVPRQMMRTAVAEVLAELAPSAASVASAPSRAAWMAQGFDLTIGCREGRSIAPRTFNPRLGIVDGISILGTSGIVEPMSMASWIASIEVYIRVALADCAGPEAALAYLPGKIGRAFVAQLGLPDRRSVQIANFLGDALDFTRQALAEQQRRLPVLWLAGHPGKLAKVLDGVWDTHSSKSNMAMQGVTRVAQTMNAAGQVFDPALLQQMKDANTVEAVIELVRGDDRARSKALWVEIEGRIATLAAARVPDVDRVEVRLFDLDGGALGVDA